MADNRWLVLAVRETLFDELALDDSVVVYVQDVSANGGVFRATGGRIVPTDGVQRQSRPPIPSAR